MHIDNSNKKKCYNCGEIDHMSNNHPNRDKRTKCFKCNKYVHIASKCSKVNVVNEMSKCIVKK